MVSIKDIALKAKVSTATVSKALNNQKDISESTKERIRKIADELGYIADSSARALRTRKSHNIGIIYADNPSGLAHAYYSKVLNAFKNEIEKRGYDITFISNINCKNISYVNYCEKRNFDGIAIITADYKKENIIELINSHIPLVTLDCPFDGCMSVLSDNLSGLSTIVDHVISKGHKKIAYIHGKESFVTSKRITGFYDAMRRHKLAVPDEYVLEAEYYNTHSCLERIKELLKLKDPPTCIIVPDDYSAIAIKSLDIDVDNDISYVGYDGLKISKALKITTFEQNSLVLGETAARKLIDVIENPETEKECIIVPGKLIEGKTVKKIK